MSTEHYKVKITCPFKIEMPEMPEGWESHTSWGLEDLPYLPQPTVSCHFKVGGTYQIWDSKSSRVYTLVCSEVWVAEGDPFGDNSTIDVQFENLLKWPNPDHNIPDHLISITKPFMFEFGTFPGHGEIHKTVEIGKGFITLGTVKENA